MAAADDDDWTRPRAAAGANAPRDYFSMRPPREDGGGWRGGRGGRDRRQGPPPPPPPPQSPQDEPAAVDPTRKRLQEQLLRAGDKGEAKTLEQLAQTLLLDVGPDASAAGVVEEVLMQCVSSLPGKLGVYAALLGLLNVRASEFVDRLVERVQLELQAALQAAHTHLARRLLQFICELAAACVVAPGDAARLLHQMVDAGGDAHLYAAIAALPNGGRVLQRAEPEGLATLLRRIDERMEAREREPGVLSAAFSDARMWPEPLGALWAAVRECGESSGWRTRALQQPQLEMERLLKSGPLHRLSVEHVVRPAAPGARFSPRPECRLVAADHELNRELTAADRAVASEQIADLFLFFHDTPSEVVRRLFALPLPFDYRHLVVESFFAHLFWLPQPPHLEAYYGSVLIGVFNATPQLLPPVLGPALNRVFQSAELLDLECRDRLAEWFAMHFSNFNYSWPWHAWQPALELGEGEPRRDLLQRILAACLRLTYRDRLRRCLPEEYAAALPAAPVEPAHPLNSDTPPAELPTWARIGRGVMEMLRARAPTEEITARLRGVQSGSAEDRVRGVVTALLALSAPSFVYLDGLLLRCQPLLGELIGDNEDARLVAVATAVDVWQHSPVHTAVVLDKLVAARVASATALARFIAQQPRRCEDAVLWKALMLALREDARRGPDTLAPGLAAAVDALSRAKPLGPGPRGRALQLARHFRQHGLDRALLAAEANDELVALLQAK